MHTPFSYTTALALAAASLNLALQLSSGFYKGDAWPFLPLTAALALSTYALTTPHPKGDGRLRLTLKMILLLQLALLLVYVPGVYLKKTTPESYLLFFEGGLCIVLLLVLSRFDERKVFALAVLIHFLLGVWMIGETPDPYTDAYFMQQDSVKALASGVSPYSLTFPDIYPNRNFYGEGVVVNGRVLMGYPYPPLSLLIGLGSYLVAGDFRYSWLLAMTISAVLMAAGTGPTGRLAALVFLFTPRTFFVLENGWTEPLLVLVFALTIYVTRRAPAALPFALGLFFASKQYTLFVVPLIFLLMPQPFRWKAYMRLLATAALVAALIYVPFLLWDSSGMINSLITTRARQPFRFDAFNYTALFANWTGLVWPGWVGFAAILGVIALAARKAPRTPSGFAAAVALLYLAFFAFGFQAFVNYYYFVVGALCCAVAATQHYEGDGVALTAQ